MKPIRSSVALLSDHRAELDVHAASLVFVQKLFSAQAALVKTAGVACDASVVEDCDEVESLAQCWRTSKLVFF